MTNVTKFNNIKEPQEITILTEIPTNPVLFKIRQQIPKYKNQTNFQAK